MASDEFAYGRESIINVKQAETDDCKAQRHATILMVDVERELRMAVANVHGLRSCGIELRQCRERLFFRGAGNNVVEVSLQLFVCNVVLLSTMQHCSAMVMGNLEICDTFRQAICVACVTTFTCPDSCLSPC